LDLLLLILIGIEGVEADVVKDELLANLEHPGSAILSDFSFLIPHLILEAVTFLQSETVTFCDNRDDVNDVAELLHHDNINGTEAVAGGIDEIQAAVNAGILDITFTLSSQFLAQVRGVLVLDVFDDRVPAG
jgi:hypothetical protein